MVILVELNTRRKKVRKISILFCLLFSVFLGNAQCDLSVIDTMHINCNGEALGGFVLDVGGAVSPYTINLNNGITQVDNPVFTSLPAAIYQVIIVDNAFCMDTIEVKIKQPAFLGLSLECNDVSLVASVYGGVGDYVYSWTNELGQEISSDTMVGYESGNFYAFSVIDENGCEQSDTVYLWSSFTASTYLGIHPLYVEFSNTSSEGLYEWDFGDENNSSQTNPFHDYNEVGAYEVALTVTDENSQCYATSTDTIDVQGFELEGELEDWAEMYNVFSPNGDQTNDEFAFLENHAIQEFKVVVYNRWGKKIYEWSDPKKGWDGSNKSGKPVRDGVYFYSMTAVGENGKEYKHKGSVSLYR